MMNAEAFAPLLYPFIFLSKLHIFYSHPLHQMQQEHTVAIYSIFLLFTLYFG